MLTLTNILIFFGLYVCSDKTLHEVNKLELGKSKKHEKEKINKKEECLHLPNPHSISQFQFQSFTPKFNIIFINPIFNKIF